MKKPTKRKMYHKRRKKEKAEQRKIDKAEAAERDKQPRPASKYRNNNRQYHRMPNKHFSTYKNQCPELTNPFNSYTQGLQVWWHTYCTAIQYHTNQQKSWNEEQKHQDDAEHTTAESNLILLEKYANEYETSSDEEDEEQRRKNNQQDLDEEDDYFLDDPSNIDTNISSSADAIDGEYLKFLEITHKHREELKLRRAEEDF